MTGGWRLRIFACNLCQIEIWCLARDWLSLRTLREYSHPLMWQVIVCKIAVIEITRIRCRTEGKEAIGCKRLQRLSASIFVATYVNRVIFHHKYNNPGTRLSINKWQLYVNHMHLHAVVSSNKWLCYPHRINEKSWSLFYSHAGGGEHRTYPKHKFSMRCTRRRLDDDWAKDCISQTAKFSCQMILMMFIWLSPIFNICIIVAKFVFCLQRGTLN